MGSRRFNSDGDLLPKYLKSSKQAHIKPGRSINLKRAINNVGGVAFAIFDIVALFTDSPQSPLYMYLSPGQGEQNRAYIDLETNQIYEWSLDEKTGLREVRTYEDYDNIDGEWRGVGLITKQFFDSNGFDVTDLAEPL